MALLITINVVLFLTHFLLAHKWLVGRGRTMSEALLAGIIGALTQVVVTIVLLGLVIHRMYVPEIFWTNLGICLLLLVIGRIRPRNFVGLIKDFFLWIWRGLGTIRRDASLFVLSIFLVVLYMWLFFVGYVMPPYSWDPMSFHLAYPGQWLQDGRMGLEPSLMDTYPRNISVIYFWEMVFPHRDDLVNCTNLLLFIPMGILAIYLIARRIRCRRRSALFTGLLYFTFPAVIQQSTTCYIDIAACPWDSSSAARATRRTSPSVRLSPSSFTICPTSGNMSA
jgi:hypothetical protein